MPNKQKQNKIKTIQNKYKYKYNTKAKNKKTQTKKQNKTSLSSRLVCTTYERTSNDTTMAMVRTAHNVGSCTVCVISLQVGVQVNLSCAVY